MNIQAENLNLDALHAKERYQITDLDSEITADRCCSALLKHFHQYLLEEARSEPLEAGSKAAGADYFLRDFMIGNRRKNIFSVSADDIEMFAGNWYIVSNLEPNLAELNAMLAGIESFSAYCVAYRLITPETADLIVSATQKSDYYQQRIDAFHHISGDGFSAWDKACPLG